MFSGEDIEAIVQNFREPVEAAPVETIEDIKTTPNNILMSYIMGAVAFNRQSLLEVFQDLESARTFLTDIAQEDHRRDPEKSLPELPPEYSYDDPLELVACAIASHSDGYFAFGSGNVLLAARKREYIHEYPSGKTVRCFTLDSEIPANVPIVQAGYSLMNKDGSVGIFVRQNSILMLSAMFGVLKDTPEFADFRDFNAAKIEYNATGIVVAHELGHVTLAQQGNAPSDYVENEMAAEKQGRQFLEENGFPMVYYRLYHRLMAPPGDEKNLSRMVLDTL